MDFGDLASIVPEYDQGIDDILLCEEHKTQCTKITTPFYRRICPKCKLEKGELAIEISKYIDQDICDAVLEVLDDSMKRDDILKTMKSELYTAITQQKQEIERVRETKAELAEKLKSAPEDYKAECKRVAKLLEIIKEGYDNGEINEYHVKEFSQKFNDFATSEETQLKTDIAFKHYKECKKILSAIKKRNPNPEDKQPSLLVPSVGMMKKLYFDEGIRDAMTAKLRKSIEEMINSRSKKSNAAKESVEDKKPILEEVSMGIDKEYLEGLESDFQDIRNILVKQKRFLDCLKTLERYYLASEEFGASVIPPTSKRDNAKQTDTLPQEKEQAAVGKNADTTKCEKNQDGSLALNLVLMILASLVYKASDILPTNKADDVLSYSAFSGAWALPQVRLLESGYGSDTKVLSGGDAGAKDTGTGGKGGKSNKGDKKEKAEDVTMSEGIPLGLGYIETNEIYCSLSHCGVLAISNLSDSSIELFDLTSGRHAKMEGIESTSILGIYKHKAYLLTRGDVISEAKLGDLMDSQCLDVFEGVGKGRMRMNPDLSLCLNNGNIYYSSSDECLVRFSCETGEEIPVKTENIHSVVSGSGINISGIECYYGYYGSTFGQPGPDTKPQYIFKTEGIGSMFLPSEKSPSDLKQGKILSYKGLLCGPHESYSPWKTQLKGMPMVRLCGNYFLFYDEKMKDFTVRRIRVP